MGVSSQDLMVILKDLGEAVKSYLSTIENDTADAVKEIVESQMAEEQQKKEEEKKKKGIPISVTDEKPAKTEEQKESKETTSEEVVYFNADQLSRLLK